MVCFDYEKVKCCICDAEIQDEYTKIKGKIVCDECKRELNETQN